MSNQLEQLVAVATLKKKIVRRGIQKASAEFPQPLVAATDTPPFPIEDELQEPLMVGSFFPFPYTESRRFQVVFLSRSRFHHSRLSFTDYRNIVHVRCHHDTLHNLQIVHQSGNFNTRSQNLRLHRVLAKEGVPIPTHGKHDETSAHRSSANMRNNFRAIRDEICPPKRKKYHELGQVRWAGDPIECVLYVNLSNVQIATHSRPQTLPRHWRRQFGGVGRV